MCLFKKHSFVRKSVKDRTVYKILLYDKYNDCYITPFRETVVDLKVIQKPKIYNYIRYVFNLFITEIIDDGFIHAFTNRDFAIAEAKNLQVYRRNNGSYTIKIFECVVPKYTSYFIGDRQDIAVKKLKYVKSIKL